MYWNCLEVFSTNIFADQYNGSLEGGVCLPPIYMGIRLEILSIVKVCHPTYFCNDLSGQGVITQGIDNLCREREDHNRCTSTIDI